VRRLALLTRYAMLEVANKSTVISSTSPGENQWV
jgi:hypothetical protein